MSVCLENTVVRESSAWTLMLGSVLCWGVYPLVLVFGGGEESPFLVNVLLRTGLALVLQRRVVVGAIGVLLVVWSQGAEWSQLLGTEVWRLTFGLLLCLVASVLGAMPACSLLWGTKFSEKLAQVRPGGELRRRLVCVPITMMVCNLATLPPGVALGLALGESWPVNPELGLWLCGVIVLGGTLSNSVSAVAQVVANWLTANSGVNVLGYLGPAASVTVLYLFWQVGVEHWWLFWLSVTLVALANVVAVGAAVRC